MRRKLYLLSKAFLLLVVIGFLMPVSCNQNGFQIAEFVKMSREFSGGGSSVNWMLIMIHTVFWAALLGVVIGCFVLYETYSKKLRQMDIALGGEILVLAAGIASVGVIVQ